ncbi:hypothetical protein Tco_1263783 [Tanacetum coccineum]
MFGTIGGRERNLTSLLGNHTLRVVLLSHTSPFGLAMVLLGRELEPEVEAVSLFTNLERELERELGGKKPGGRNLVVATSEVVTCPDPYSAATYFGGVTDWYQSQEQAPPLPIYVPFVPKPVYPEFLPVDDELRKRSYLFVYFLVLGYEVGESSAASAARQVGPTTAEADLYGFADYVKEAVSRTPNV